MSVDRPFLVLSYRDLRRDLIHLRDVNLLSVLRYKIIIFPDK